MKLKICLIVFILNVSFFAFGQHEYVQGKCLLILDGHKEKLEAEKLKNKGINCYVKFSGFLKSKKATLEDNVKFIISGKYIVIDKLSDDFSYTGRNHELIYRHYGTPVDLLSEIKTDEIPPGALPWQKNGFSLIGTDGKLIENVKIVKFHVLSRIQIERYRPSWCFEAEDYNACVRGKYPESKIKRYIWYRKKYSQYLIAEIDNSGGMLAIYNGRYIPKLYKEIDYRIKINSTKEILDTLPKSLKIQEIYNEELPQSEKNETLKWYNHKYAKYNSRMFVLESDTLFFMSYGILDDPCGGYIEQSGSNSWRIKDGKFHELRPVDSDFNYIFQFENKDVFIYKFNHNTNSLNKIDEYAEIDLPYTFIDPWEC